MRGVVGRALQRCAEAAEGRGAGRIRRGSRHPLSAFLVRPRAVTVPGYLAEAMAARSDGKRSRAAAGRLASQLRSRTVLAGNPFYHEERRRAEEGAERAFERRRRKRAGLRARVLNPREVNEALGLIPPRPKLMRRQRSKERPPSTRRAESHETAMSRLATTRPIVYGPDESSAYLLSRTAPVYAAVQRVLGELAPELTKPARILDFGSGPGTGLLCALDVLGDDAVERIVAVEPSSSMESVARDLVGARMGGSHSVGAGGKISWRRFLAMDAPADPARDGFHLVMASYVLSEMRTQIERDTAIRSLWPFAGEALVLLEPGTPVGFENISKAREALLATGEGHVAGPCPHDRPCPVYMRATQDPAEPAVLSMTRRRMGWCHFSQRVVRPRALRDVKSAVQDFENEKFCYLVFRRGPRPEAAHPAWDRILSEPRRRSGHVIVHLCEGGRMAATRRRNPVAFEFGTEAGWGDRWPRELTS